MRVFGWLLAALAGWTGIGLIGTVLALATRDRRRAWRGLGWMVTVWVIYLGVLLGVGRWQGQKLLEVGQEECFGPTCYSVTNVSSVGEFKGLGGGNLVQVGLRVRNGGSETAGVEGLRAYLIDSEGRKWGQTRGVGGVALTVALPPGGVTVSEPVFRVEAAGGLRLVLTRGYAGWGWLTIGDTDSLGHRKTLLRLE